MDFSKFLHGFVNIDSWISLSFYMDLSKLLHGFVKVDTWIFQRCSLYSSPFARLKFYQDFKTCWASALNYRWWMSQSAQCLGVCNAFGNVFSAILTWISVPPIAPCSNNGLIITSGRQNVIWAHVLASCYVVTITPIIDLTTEDGE